MQRSSGNIALAGGFCLCQVQWPLSIATAVSALHIRVRELPPPESVTSGTIFHRTRTALRKWFLAGHLMGGDKRGVSATYLQRELRVA